VSLGKRWRDGSGLVGNWRGRLVCKEEGRKRCWVGESAQSPLCGLHLGCKNEPHRGTVRKHAKFPGRRGGVGQALIDKNNCKKTCYRIIKIQVDKKLKANMGLVIC